MYAIIETERYDSCMKKIIDFLLNVLLICWWLFILHDSIFYQQTDYSQYEYYRLYLRSPVIIILLY